MSVLIAQFKNETDADFVAKLIRKMKDKVKVMDEKSWEDYLLGLMIEETEMEGGEVSRKEISKIFKKNGINFKTEIPKRFPQSKEPESIGIHSRDTSPNRSSKEHQRYRRLGKTGRLQALLPHQNKNI